MSQKFLEVLHADVNNRSTTVECKVCKNEYQIIVNGYTCLIDVMDYVCPNCRSAKDETVLWEEKSVKRC